MRVRQCLAQVGGDLLLVGGIEMGEEQTDRHRLGAALAQRCRQSLRLALAKWLDDAVRPDPLGGLEAQLRPDQRRRLRRAEAVEIGAVLAGDLEQVGEATGRDQRRAGAAFLQQRVGADGHPVGEDLDRAGLGAGPGQHLAHRRHHSLGLGAGGGRDLGAVDGALVEQDRVGEGAADVDPEQHQTQVSRRTSPPGPSTRWTPSRSWSSSGRSVRRWPPRDSRRARAEAAIAFASG